MQNQKGNKFLALGDDDDDVFNDPSIVAAATQPNPRKADAGDFDTTKDTRITNYLKDKWRGHRPDDQILNVAKLVVTIWARDHPGYHAKQLGNNFNGAKKLGGLLAALGRSRLKSLKQVTALLKENVRDATDVDKLCGKLDEINQDARALPESNPQPQPQQQPTSQPQRSSTNGKQVSQPLSRSSNKTSTPNTAKNNTITSHFNPLTNIPIDLTSSQEQKSNAQEQGDMHFDSDTNDSSSDHDRSEQGDDGLTGVGYPPSSPLKRFINNSKAVATGSNILAAANLSLLGGLPAASSSSTDPTATDGSTTN